MAWAEAATLQSGTGKRLEFEAGQALFRQGDAAREAYLIERGRVEVSFVLDGETLVIGYRHPGELVGEMALIDRQPRSATAMAVEPTVCVPVSDGLLAEHMARSTPLVRNMLSAFTRNLRIAIDNQIASRSRERSPAT